MTLLHLSEVAQKYYLSLKGTTVQGWEKYVLTNGLTSMFVKSDYEPKQGEAVFFLQMRQGEVMCQLHKEGPALDRFFLKYEGNMMWRVSERDSGISISFREGLLNETQKVEHPNDMPQSVITRLPTIMKDFGQWMYDNHRWVAICSNKEARISVIHKLDNEDWWKTMVAAMNGYMYQENIVDPLFALGCEVTDFLEEFNPFDINPIELIDWLGIDDITLDEEDDENPVDRLSSAEALEAIHIIQNFWESNSDVGTWARDLLWWPTWVNAK